MIKVTIDVKFNKNKFEKDLMHAALEGLKEHVENAITPYKSDITKEGGSVNVKISGLGNVEIQTTGLSDSLNSKITDSIRNLTN